MLAGPRRETSIWFRHPRAISTSAYEALLQAGGAKTNGGFRYVDALQASAYESSLIETIFGRELGATGIVTGACPAPSLLSDEERLLFVRWIDMGAPYRGGDSP